MNAIPASLAALAMTCGCGPEGRTVDGSEQETAKPVTRPASERDRLYQKLLLDVDRWETVFLQQPRNAVALRRQADEGRDTFRKLFPTPAPGPAPAEKPSTPAPAEGTVSDRERAQRVLDTHHRYAGPGARPPHDTQRLAVLPKETEERAVKDVDRAIKTLAAHWTEGAPTPATSRVRQEFQELRAALDQLSALAQKSAGKEQPKGRPAGVPRND